MFFTTLLLSASVLSAQMSDTLQAVRIVADKGVVVSMTDTVSITGSDNVADVVQKIPALSLSDYGGAAGLKTVSLRGLGSAHTAIYVDGVRVGNMQSGQADLGFLDAASFGSAIIDYAQNSLSFKTARPVFGNSPVSGRVRLDGASFGTFLPSGRIAFRLDEKTALSASVSAVLGKGDYPYGDGQRRTNNDISQIKAGADLFRDMDNGHWQMKAYFAKSDRGTPGAASWPSEDRQKDLNAFVQGTFQKNFSKLYALNLSAKAAYDKIFYSSSWGDSNYAQKEVQLNSSHRFDLNYWLKLSFAASAQWDGLLSTEYEASRASVISAIASAISFERFKAGIALQYDGSFDKGGLGRNTFSPSADLRFKAFRGFDIVAFARRAYRVPTFNELYFKGYGNPSLRPEDAWLTDIGAEWHGKAGKAWSFNARLDGFYNSLKDKISSAPSAEDPNIWLPYNIGKVEAVGIDASAGFRYSSAGWEAGFSARYSLQDARDRTPDSIGYGKQIAYTARHTGVVTADAAYRGWKMDLVWNWRGGRFDSTGSLPDWNTIDLSLAKSFRLKDIGDLSLRLRARNLADFRYETVRDYPMPGRSVMAGIEFKF